MTVLPLFRRLKPLLGWIQIVFFCLFRRIWLKMATFQLHMFQIMYGYALGVQLRKNTPLVISLIVGGERYRLSRKWGCGGCETRGPFLGFSL
ncbi:hypothetical protein Y032_0209g2099 [Ancylostoma ceylanicum]|nr:hypothetical protein Y032_0209g2099 [Ancylostoma ceylanicum]